MDDHVEKKKANRFYIKANGILS